MLLPSFKQQNKKTNFYERETYIELFNKELDNVKENNINLLMYYGIGGIGKTTLLKHLYQNHTNNNIKLFINLEDYSKPLDFYSKLIDEFSKERIELFNFKIAFAIYWNKLNPNLAMKENFAFKGEWNAIVPIIDQVGFGVGSIFKALYEYKDEFKNKFLNNYKMELEELESKSYKELELLLPKFLYYDLEIAMKKRDEKIIFFLDTHEYLFETNKKENNKIKSDLFIRDLILTLNSIKTLFVISGRERLIWHNENEEWDKYIKQIELNSMSKDSSIKYLQDNGILSLEIAEHIVNYTDCVPFYLNLELNTYLKLDNPTIADFNRSKTKKDIFNRFILYADNNELQLLKVLSFAKKFNIELFEAIIKDFNIPISILMFDDFISNSYITELDNGEYSLHNLMKISIQDSVKYILRDRINKFLFNFSKDKPLEQLSYAFEFMNLVEVSNYIQEFIKNKDNRYNTLINSSLMEEFIFRYKDRAEGLAQNLEELDDELKSFMDIYNKLNFIYIKDNNQLAFNNLNISFFKNIKVIKYIDNYKRYLFLLNILNRDRVDYTKTMNFYKKIKINTLKDEDRVNLKIEIANLHRKNRRKDLSFIIFNELEEIDYKFSDEQLYQLRIKKGFYFKSMEEPEKAILEFEKAKPLVQNKIQDAKLDRAFGEIYLILKVNDKATYYLKNSIKKFDKIYGELNRESNICRAILERHDVDIEDEYYQFYALLSNKLNKLEIEKNLEIIYNILEKENSPIKLENMYKTILSRLSVFKSSMFDIDELLKILLSSDKVDNKTILLYSYNYAKSYDKEIALKYIKILYNELEEDKNKKILNQKTLLRLVATSYSYEILKIEFDLFFLNIGEKMELMALSKDWDRLLRSLINNDNIKYYYLADKFEIDGLVESVKKLSEDVSVSTKILDILYSKVIKYYEEVNNKEMIEKYLIKQVKIRENLNLNNLDKAYSFLAMFYKKNDKIELANSYFAKIKTFKLK